MFPPACGAEVQKKRNPILEIGKRLLNKKNGKENAGSSVMNEPLTYKGQCKSRDFTTIENTSCFSDYQEVKFQELFKTLQPGLIPRSIPVILEVS